MGLSWRLCISQAHLAGVTNTNAEGVAFLTPAADATFSAQAYINCPLCVGQAARNATRYII